MFRSYLPELKAARLLKPTAQLEHRIQCSLALLPESLLLLIVLNVTLEKTLNHHGSMKPYSNHISY